MGVDFFDCEICDRWVADCGPYFSCGACGHSICEACEKEYKAGKFSDEPWPTYVDEETGEEVEDDEDDRNCPFCNLKEISDYSLLEFVLKQLNKTKDELKEEYRKFYSETDESEQDEYDS